MVATTFGVVEAHAADPEALVLEGIALRKDHRDLEALRVFRLAYAESPRPRIRAQIGLAEQALGKWIEAEVDVSAALAEASDPWIEKNAPTLRAALTSIREHLGWLEVTGTAGAMVFVNGVARGALPLAQPVRVVAGTVAVEGRKEGFVTKPVVVDVPPAGTVQHVVALEETKAPVKPVVAPTPIREAPPPRPVSRVSTLGGFALLSVGLTGLVIGTWYGVQTIRLRNQRDEHCTGGSCDPYGGALDGDARSAGWVSTVGFAVAIPALVAGTWLLLRTPSTEVTLQAKVAPGGSTFVLGGTF